MSTEGHSAKAAAPQRVIQASTHRVWRLHQPARLVVALVELLLAAGLVVLAFWCWQNGIVRISYPDGVFATRYLGSWIAGSIGLAVLAGLFLLDFFRQLVLGVRTGRRPSTTTHATSGAP